MPESICKAMFLTTNQTYFQVFPGGDFIKIQGNITINKNGNACCFLICFFTHQILLGEIL